MDTPIKKGPPGSGRGTGRKPGSRNKVPTEVKRDVREFFKNLTVENLRWRQNVARRLTQTHDPVEFRNWTRIALEYGFGLPSKMVPEVKQREPLRFLSVYLQGRLPWDESVDPMKAKTDAMIAKAEADRAAAQANKALEAQNVAPAVAPVIDSEALQELEVVTPKPEFGDYQGRR